MTAATPRLARLLALVPYLVARPGVAISDVTSVFGIDEAELRKDLELLFVCGLPGYSPGDLIDVSFTGDRITVTNAATIERPLRLSPDEALALLVAARSLAAVPGLAERDSLDRALVKLAAASGAGAAAAKSVAVEVEPEGEALETVRRALRDRKRLHLTYHSAARDELTERDVDPMRVAMVDGWWYVEGWCHRVDGVRLFRLDRVVSADVLDVDAEIPEQAETRDLSEGVFQPAAEHQLVVLDVGPGARWVADYYPCESAEEIDEPAGGLRLSLRVADPSWLVRLVLRLGPNATLREPATLVAEVRAQAERALSTYAERA